MSRPFELRTERALDGLLSPFPNRATTATTARAAAASLNYRLESFSQLYIGIALSTYTSQNPSSVPTPLT